MLTVIASCQEEIEVGHTATGIMAGEWFVEMSETDEGGNIVANYGYSNLITYNTSDNNETEMWLTDDDTFWWYKVKVNINLEDLTFSVTDGVDLRFDDNTTITNGKIIPNAATPPSGVKADSIYFEVEWASDPGTIYVGSGYRRTGFLEDEH